MKPKKITEAEFQAHCTEMPDELPPKSSSNYVSAKFAAIQTLCDRQDWKCFWCGEEMSKDNPQSPRYRTLEHVIPSSFRKKGANHKSNLRASCRACNEDRALWPTFKSLDSKIKLLNDQIFSKDKTIERNKVTMHGRCYWCKAKFHIKNWLWRRNG